MFLVTEAVTLKKRKCWNEGKYYEGVPHRKPSPTSRTTFHMETKRRFAALSSDLTFAVVKLQMVISNTCYSYFHAGLVLFKVHSLKDLYFNFEIYNNNDDDNNNNNNNNLIIIINYKA